MFRHHLLFLLLPLASIFIGAFAHTQDPSSAKSTQWALLIAAEDYQKAPKLQFTVNDVRRLRETFEWFRGLLDACPASFKLLVLDACHAGSEKGEDGPPSASAKDISDSFKGATGVVTIASSTAEEKSRIWEFKQQSLFSYWLNEGLKGHSD